MKIFCSSALLGVVIAISASAARASSISPGPIPESATIFDGSVADSATSFFTGESFESYAPGTACGVHGDLCLPAESIPVSGVTVSSSNGSSFLSEQTGVLLPVGQEGDLIHTAVTGIAPEPESLVLLGTGLLSVAGLAFRQRRAVA